jgi:cyclopropane-fatty-acyl-phospholipid synthase
MFAVELAELPMLDRDLRLFGHNRRQVFSIRDRDYLGIPEGTIEEKLRARLRGAAAKRAFTRAVLLTTPRVFGHTFNPVSFYYCYDEFDELVYVVAEVNNTFGEGHLYLLAADAKGRIRQREPKAFHVSPFNDLRGDYDFRLEPLGDHLDIGIRLCRDEASVFDARLRGRARPISNRELLRVLMTYPLQTFLTLPRIGWQAFKLHYFKRLPVHAKPEPGSASTFKSTYPPYRIDAGPNPGSGRSGAGME